MGRGSSSFYFLFVKIGFWLRKFLHFSRWCWASSILAVMELAVYSWRRRLYYSTGYCRGSAGVLNGRLYGCSDGTLTLVYRYEPHKETSSIASVSNDEVVHPAAAQGQTYHSERHAHITLVYYDLVTLPCLVHMLVKKLLYHCCSPPRHKVSRQRKWLSIRKGSFKMVSPYAVPTKMSFTE